MLVFLMTMVLLHLVCWCKMDFSVIVSEYYYSELGVVNDCVFYLIEADYMGRQTIGLTYCLIVTHKKVSTYKKETIPKVLFTTATHQ